MRNMFCVGTEELFSDIINQTEPEDEFILLENEKRFELKYIGKKYLKLDVLNGDTWEYNHSTNKWDLIEKEIPKRRIRHIISR